MSNHARFLWTLIALAAMLLTGCPPAEDTGDTGSADEAVAEGHEGHGDSPFHAEGVESAIENIDNGVTVTFTTENADQVTELQEFVAKKAEGDAHEGCKHECACKWEGVTKSYENLDNGVTMTLTAEDAELVTKIQEFIAAKAEGGHGGGHHGEGHEAHADGPWAIFHAEGVTRTAENLDNGVKMLFTCGCPHKQEKMQTAAATLVEHMASDEAKAAHADSPFHMEGVTMTTETIEGGVALTFVAEDAELVTKIQEHGALKMEAAGEKTECGCKHKEEAQEA
jgi:phage terminase large subunit-like protein